MAEKKADVGEEKQVKDRRSAHKIARDTELEYWRELLRSYAGRAFIWFLLGQCGIYRAASGEVNELIRGEGRRDVGLVILKELEDADPTAYAKIRDEGVSRDTKLRGKNNG